MRRFMYFNWLISGNGIGISGILALMFAKLLVAAIIIFILAFLFKSKSKIIYKNMVDSTKSSNYLLSLLNERLVKGEITIEEYQKLKTEILSK